MNVMNVLPKRCVCRQLIMQIRFYQSVLDNITNNSTNPHINTEEIVSIRKCMLELTENPIQRKSSCSNKEKMRTFHSIPTPKGLPIIGTIFDLLSSGGAPMIHEYCDRRHRELGPIYRECLGSVDAVFVADSDLIQQVYSNEGKYPKHMVPEPWIIYNEMYGKQRGLFFMDGQKWSQRRKSLNKVFLKQRSVSEYSDEFNNVISELLQRWLIIRDNKNTLPNLEKELYNWSIESLGTMIFGRRLGCVQAEKLGDIHEFVHCVQQIFLESARMTMIPPRLASLLNLPVWKRFVKAANRALELAQSYVEENVTEIIKKANTGEPVEGILSQLLLKDKIEGEEIVRIITDLFLAAADTTSHATQWTLYLLAKNPRCQYKLLDEVSKIVGTNDMINESHLVHLPYVKAIIKEALRIYPVAPFLTRILSKDITLKEYLIPKGTLILMSLYTTGRDQKYYSNPNHFYPERWIRDSEFSNSINSYAFLPFGIGSRSCIGRRVAELQMQFLITRIVQLFHLQLENKNDVNIKMRMITTPDQPIQLQMIERKMN
ncbi:cytochrome P450 315a1, mitochondrial-like [Centruroides sculpturatus]|uniref:cytochrome P450 315a1, mitochondrial-like n=1 Tax=Centruroides sculpturatus TaxID=218467 RepID=UPI000C6E71F0|nr:cytochrome P450 315a1, mitochondrial-like [Centruroides sculpturatus]